MSRLGSPGKGRHRVRHGSWLWGWGSTPPHCWPLIHGWWRVQLLSSAVLSCHLLLPIPLCPFPLSRAEVFTDLQHPHCSCLCDGHRQHWATAVTVLL